MLTVEACFLGFSECFELDSARVGFWVHWTVSVQCDSFGFYLCGLGFYFLECDKLEGCPKLPLLIEDHEMPLPPSCLFKCLPLVA